MRKLPLEEWIWVPVPVMVIAAICWNLVGISLSVEPNEAVYIPLMHTGPMGMPDELDQFTQFVDDLWQKQSLVPHTDPEEHLHHQGFKNPV